MNPTQTLLTEWLPQGSNLYYSLLNVHEAERPALVALYAYSATLNHIAERYHEPAIAKLKLQWWQEEVARAYEGRAEHVIMKNLQGDALKRLPQKALLAMIEAAQLSLDTQRFANQAQLAQHYQHTGGIVQGLMARLLAPDAYSETIERFTHTLGVALETVRHLTDMPYHFARQHFYVPEESLEKVTEVERLLQQPREHALLLPLLQEQVAYARGVYQDALAVLQSREARHPYRPLLIYAALTFATLAKMEKDQLRVFEKHYALWPLKKWWIQRALSS